MHTKVLKFLYCATLLTTTALCASARDTNRFEVSGIALGASVDAIHERNSSVRFNLMYSGSFKDYHKFERPYKKWNQFMVLASTEELGRQVYVIQAIRTFPSDPDWDQIMKDLYDRYGNPKYKHTVFGSEPVMNYIWERDSDKLVVQVYRQARKLWFELEDTKLKKAVFARYERSKRGKSISRTYYE